MSEGDRGPRIRKSQVNSAPADALLWLAPRLLGLALQTASMEKSLPPRNLCVAHIQSCFVTGNKMRVCPSGARSCGQQWCMYCGCFASLADIPRRLSLILLRAFPQLCQGLCDLPAIVGCCNGMLQRRASTLLYKMLVKLRPFQVFALRFWAFAPPLSHQCTISCIFLAWTGCGLLLCAWL